MMSSLPSDSFKEVIFTNVQFKASYAVKCDINIYGLNQAPIQEMLNSVTISQSNLF